MRELRPQNELNLPRDAAPILTVLAATWDCEICDPPVCKTCGLLEHKPVDGHKFERNRRPVSEATVTWLGRDTLGPHGRCHSCGQKYALAHALDKHIPSFEEQLGGEL